MNAHVSLLDNFTNMQEEFNSSNNRMLRALNCIFDNEFNDLEESLDYFNSEYVVVDKRDLSSAVNSLKEKVKEDKLSHVMKFQKVFEKEVENLKRAMCEFFDAKVAKGDCVKKKMSCEVKNIMDKICDFNFIGFEEELDTDIYNFKVNFELHFINDESCKDDFNKVVRSFEHSLFEKLREEIAHSVMEKQEVVSRHTSEGYEIVDSYRAKMKCNCQKR